MPSELIWQPHDVGKSEHVPLFQEGEHRKLIVKGVLRNPRQSCTLKDIFKPCMRTAKIYANATIVRMRIEGSTRRSSSFRLNLFISRIDSKDQKPCNGRFIQRVTSKRNKIKISKTLLYQLQRFRKQNLIMLEVNDTISCLAHELKQHLSIWIRVRFAGMVIDILSNEQLFC